MIKRNEAKFLLRNRARKTPIVAEVFRPELIDWMITARNRLRDVRDTQDCYTVSEIPGLGKNFITEKSRIKGIKTYEFFIEHYCLRGLAQRCGWDSAVIFSDGFPAIYHTPTNDLPWEHRRTILCNEGFATRTIAENLRRLIVLEELIVQSIQRSKEKDDVRGERIIPDYIPRIVRLRMIPALRIPAMPWKY